MAQRNLDVWYREHGIEVVGCCEYEQGYYCGYHENDGPIIENEFWVNMTDIKTVIRDLNLINTKFSVQTERDKVGEVLGRLYISDQPFGYTTRFMLGRSFLRIDKGTFASIISQISAAASYKERSEEKKDAANANAPKDVNRGVENWTYNDAATSFSKGIRSFVETIASKAWTYDRHKFENSVRFRWCPGLPECPKPVVTDECRIRPPKNGDGDDNKKPPNKPKKYYVKDLREFINRVRRQSHKLRDFKINLQENNSTCENYCDAVPILGLADQVPVPVAWLVYHDSDGDGKTLTSYDYDLEREMWSVVHDRGDCSEVCDNVEDRSYILNDLKDLLSVYNIKNRSIEDWRINLNRPRIQEIDVDYFNQTVKLGNLLDDTEVPDFGLLLLEREKGENDNGLYKVLYNLLDGKVMYKGVCTCVEM